jgi:hypothetical protein
MHFVSIGAAAGSVEFHFVAFFHAIYHLLSDRNIRRSKGPTSALSEVACLPPALMVVKQYKGMMFKLETHMFICDEAMSTMTSSKSTNADYRLCDSFM